MRQDLKIALRSLIGAPAFAAASVLTVAVAIGMATSVFTIVNALLLRPLHYAHAGQRRFAWDPPRAGRSWRRKPSNRSIT